MSSHRLHVGQPARQSLAPVSVIVTLRGQRGAMILARSRFEAPSAMRDRTRRSIETVGSPASILATRDWLELTAFAKSTCVRRFRTRRLFSPSASFKRRSINASSSGVSPRNSPALPSFQPRLASLRRLVPSIVILPETPSARLNNALRRCPALLGKHLRNYHGIFIDSIQNAPSHACIVDAKLVATRPNRRHRPAVRQTNSFASLQSSKQKARFNASCRTEWRTFDFTMKPGQRLVFRAQGSNCMSVLTYQQPNKALHSDAGAPRRFPRSLLSLGAGERERYAPR